MSTREVHSSTGKLERIGRDLAGTVTKALLQVFLVAGHAPAPLGVLQVR